MSIFNVDSRVKKVSEMLVRGEDYLEVVDGNQSIRNYVNLNNEKYCKREGYLEFQPMKNNKGMSGSLKHENIKVFRTVLDRKTGLTWGIPTDIDPETKQWKHQPIIVEGPIVLDLSIKDQANIAAMIKNSTFCEGSPNLIGKPEYKIIDRERIADTKVKEIAYRRKAEDIIFGLDEDALIEVAINNGINVGANRKLSMLTAELHRVMNLDPKKFVDDYENKDRVYVSIFNKALSINVITHDVKTGSYMYMGLPLGHSVDMAIKYLKDNNSTATAISLKSKDVDKESNISMSATDEVSVDNPYDLLDDTKPVTTANPFADEVAKEEKVDSEEMVRLRARAKELKIKGYHLKTLTEEALLIKIKEAEAE